MTFDTFWIERGYTGREALAVLDRAHALGYGYEWSVNPNWSRSIPIGSVEFCESFLERKPIPDFYPDWLESWFHRTIYCGVDHFQFCDRGDWFVKSAESYKQFPARIWNDGENPLEGLVDISAPVKFTQEWRCYVADGCVLTTGWYDGDNEDEPAPDLNIDWPKGFCGAVDFGRLDNGKIALVESHHPYACGHYSGDHDARAN